MDLLASVPEFNYSLLSNDHVKMYFSNMPKEEQLHSMLFACLRLGPAP